MKLLFENWRRYLLTERYSEASALESLKPNNKKMRNLYKRYVNGHWHEDVAAGSLDPEWDPEPKVPEEKINKAAAGYRGYILEVIPEDIWGQNAVTPEQRKKEADKNIGLAIMWVRKLSIENPKIARDIIDGEISYSSQRVGGYSNIMPDLEIYFQNLDLMPKKNLIELKSFQQLHDMVEVAREEIENRRHSNIWNIAVVDDGTTFLSGGWNKEIPPAEEVNKMSKEEQTELFKGLKAVPGKNGWAIMEINNKAASCFHGTADWCTADPKSTYFNEYWSQGDPLFIFEAFWTDPTAKFQFHYGSESFMDAGDRPVNKETLKKLHNLLMQTEAPGKYKVVQHKQYDMIAGDSDTPAEELANIIDYHIHDADLPSSVLEKVAKNAKTPLEDLKKLYKSAVGTSSGRFKLADAGKYIIRNIQVNPVIDFELAKEILMSYPKDDLIWPRGTSQMARYKRNGEISAEEYQKIIDDVFAARNYDPPRIPREVANLYERIIKIRVKK